MKIKIWTSSVIAGIVATSVLIALSLTLYFTGVMSLSISEYAARFVLNLDGKEMNIYRWIVGFMTNFSLGCLFGILSSFLYKITGIEEKLVKILSIGVSCWFFQLVIVPALSPEMAKYSTYDIAISYYFLYLIWAWICSSIIIRYSDFKK